MQDIEAGDQSPGHLRLDPPDDPAGGHVRGWLIPLIVGSALLMQSLNATVLANALPVMAKSLGEDPLRLNLAITVYLLAVAVFLPLTGWLADKFGARRVFLASILFYAVASIACGLSQNLAQLLIARAFQGAVASALMPVGRLVLLRTTPKSELVRALSVLTMPVVFGPLLGPLIGGTIVTVADWQWIFYLNLPLAALGLVLVRRYVPEVEPQEVSPVDLRGILLIGVGLAALVFGFEILGRGEIPLIGVIGIFVVSIAALSLYARHAKGNPHAIIDLSIFRHQTFRASVVGGAFTRIIVGTNAFLLAMLLQIGFGMSPLSAGLITCTVAAGSFLMKTTAPPILRRFGFRNVLIVNGVVMGLTFMSYSLFQPWWPHWAMMLVLGLSGIFFSLQFTALIGLAFADIDHAEMSRASTTASICQQLVQSVSMGLVAALLHLLLVLRGETELSAASVSPAFVIIGAATMISLAWFVRLPTNAGDELNRRG